MTSDSYAAGIADSRAIAKVYGHSFESAHTLALAISTDVICSGRLVAPPGAMLGCDERFLQTSASAVAGNSGSALCPVDNPTHLLGVHIGGASRESLQSLSSHRSLL